MTLQQEHSFSSVLQIWGITTPRKFGALSSLSLWQPQTDGAMHQLQMAPQMNSITGPGGLTLSSSGPTLPPKNLIATVRRAGLNLSWLTSRADPEAYACMVFHRASDQEITFRADADLSSCLAVKGSDPGGRKARFASALMRLMPHVSALVPENEHQRLVQVGRAPDIHIADDTADVTILEAMALRGEERAARKTPRCRGDRGTR